MQVKPPLYKIQQNAWPQQKAWLQQNAWPQQKAWLQQNAVFQQKTPQFGGEYVYNSESSPLFVKQVIQDQKAVAEGNRKLGNIELALGQIGGKLDQLITLLTPVNPPTKDL